MKSDVIDNIPGEYAACLIVVANVSDIETRVLSMKDPHNLLGGSNITLIDEVSPGAGLETGDATTLNISVIMFMGEWENKHLPFCPFSHPLIN